ncbi:DUF2069 domain-containing protein [Paraneptunicella aestuarii]|uniref:DUF2069 domain-containing protein n=1 Tax=Paraneptunicella aestuarii TaxID=2831148 RepID=UPI001E4F0F8B|nr:DUF2069 domain-containing protein [Paraneptunicella aestuarii]UAA40336.1 DUF2069 domain-containing protein [Paraneptunicella aestuarii]
MSDKTKLFRAIALFGYFGLLIWMVLWHFVLIPDSPYSVLFRVLFWIVPLLLPLKGMIQGKPYTHAWANFIVMFYLLHGLTAIYSNADEWVYALIEILLATAMFIGCSFYARFRGRELGLGLKKLKTE